MPETGSSLFEFYDNKPFVTPLDKHLKRIALTNFIYDAVIITDVIDRFIFSHENDAFVKEILSDKSKTKEFLDILLSWVRDCLLVKVGISENKLVHIDRADELDRFQSRYTFDELLDLNSEIIGMFQLLSDNLNLKIPMLIIKEKLWAK